MELKFSGKIETVPLKAPTRDLLILPLMTIELRINIPIVRSLPVPEPEQIRDLMSGLFLLLLQFLIQQLILFLLMGQPAWR